MEFYNNSRDSMKTICYNRMESGEVPKSFQRNGLPHPLKNNPRIKTMVTIGIPWMKQAPFTLRDTEVN